MLAISLAVLLYSPAVSGQEDAWWHGTFVTEYDAKALIKEGHARPFNCNDAQHGLTTIDEKTIARSGRSKCKIENITKIRDYEVIIIDSYCKRWEEELILPSSEGVDMLLRLEPEGRMLSYHSGKVGKYHLPFVIELSACEWRE